MVLIMDSASTTGAGKQGLAWNTVGLTWYYRREDQGDVAMTQVSLQNMTRGTWVTGGFIQNDSSNGPGLYELGIPDAVIAAGAKWAVMMLRGAAGMADLTVELELVAYDPADGVRLGLTALPNATAGGANGLPTADSANAVKIQNGTGDNQLDIAGQSGQVKVNRIANNTITSSAIATDAIGSAQIATAGADKVATSVWAAGTRALTDKVGFALTAAESRVIQSGTAQAGSASTIQLQTSASTTVDIYKGQLVKLTGGTWAGQTRTITAYASDRTATVDRNWLVSPDSSTTYAVESADSAALNSSLQVSTSAADPWATALPGGTSPYGVGTAGYIIGNRVDVVLSTRLAPLVAGRQLDVDANGAATLQPPYSDVVQTGTALGSGSSSITLADTAVTTTDFYKGNQIRIVSGPGAGQARVIVGTAVSGGHTVATVDRAWITSPTSSSVYAIIGTEGDALDTFLKPSVDTVATVTNPIIVGSVNTDAIAAASVSAGAAAKIGGAVWDENIVSGHSAGSSAGLILSQLTKRAVNFSTDAVQGSLLRQMADDGTAIFTRTTHSLQAIRDGATTLQGMVNGIWNEPRISHPNVGSFGEGVNVQALNAQAKTDVRGEVQGGLGTDTIPELPQAQPPVTPTVKQILMLLYMALRNRADSDSSGGFNKIYNDAGTVIAKAAISDAASVFTRAKLQSGP